METEKYAFYRTLIVAATIAFAVVALIGGVALWLLATSRFML